MEVERNLILQGTKGDSRRYRGPWRKRNGQENNEINFLTLKSF